MERGAIPPPLYNNWKRQRPMGRNEPLVSSRNPTWGRWSPAFPQYWEAAAINKGGRSGGDSWKSAEAGERSAAVQFSFLGLAVES